MAKEYKVSCTLHCYNCAMATINYLSISDSKGNYVDKTTISPDHIDGIVAKFFEYLHTGQKVGAAGYSTKLSFYLFHDNIKSLGESPLYDMSSLMHYLYVNQIKYGCTVMRSHLADNLYHPPHGSHPGCVYILTPPQVQAYVADKHIPEVHRSGIRMILPGGSLRGGVRLVPEDEKFLKKLAAF